MDRRNLCSLWFCALVLVAPLHAEPAAEPQAAIDTLRALTRELNGVSAQFQGLRREFVDVRQLHGPARRAAIERVRAQLVEVKERVAAKEREVRRQEQRVQSCRKGLARHAATGSDAQRAADAATHAEAGAALKESALARQRAHELLGRRRP